MKSRLLSEESLGIRGTLPIRIAYLWEQRPIVERMSVLYKMRGYMTWRVSFQCSLHQSFPPFSDWESKFPRTFTLFYRQSLMPAEIIHCLEACNAMLSVLNKLQSSQSYVKARRSSFLDTRTALRCVHLYWKSSSRRSKQSKLNFRFWPTTLTSSNNPFVMHAVASLQNPDQKPSKGRASTFQCNPIKIIPAQVTLPNGEISPRSFIRSP